MEQFKIEHLEEIDIVSVSGLGYITEWYEGEDIRNFSCELQVYTKPNAELSNYRIITPEQKDIYEKAKLAAIILDNIK